MITLQQWLISARMQLQNVSAESALEADLLLSYVLQQPRSYLYAHAQDMLDINLLPALEVLITRRLRREPIAYIIGEREFWSLPLRVTSDTLIPRPETELLVELILAQYANVTTPLQVADLGTGSGAIALALASARPDWQFIATDMSFAALEVAKENAARLKLANIQFLQGDWCAALPHAEFNVIVSNPPYIADTEWDMYAQGLAYEPRSALTSGKEGLDSIRKISQSARRYLATGGYLFLEHGFQQAALVRAQLLAEGFVAIDSKCDLSGLERVTYGCKD